MLRGKLRVDNPAYPKEGRCGSGQNSAVRDGREDIKNKGTALGTLDASTRQVMVDAISVISEQLAREISLCFRYYTVTFRGKKVERAVISGGGAYERILLDVLKRQLAVEVELAQPLRGFDMMSLNFDSDRRSCLCEWAVAVGLGLKGWSGDMEFGKEGLVTSAPRN
jgi:Tfp pilus assembly PilM family ATPase